MCIMTELVNFPDKINEKVSICMFSCRFQQAAYTSSILNISQPENHLDNSSASCILPIRLIGYFIDTDE